MLGGWRAGRLGGLGPGLSRLAFVLAPLYKKQPETTKIMKFNGPIMDVPRDRLVRNNIVRCWRCMLVGCITEYTVDII